MQGIAQLKNLLILTKTFGRVRECIPAGSIYENANKIHNRNEKANTCVLALQFELPHA